ncbi:MAG: hypothetical protein K2L12_05000 [Clostridia bacterium]|nr:hypothetical protein [Clostridia bacterium]
MNKFLKRAISIGLCASMGVSVVAMSGCKQPLDAETRELKLSTAALDGNFNPFFYTSLTDGNMVSMTQLPLITGDAEGKLVCGENEACVALDQKTTMYDANGNVMATGGSMQGKTEYEYVIKNGIKFSDGQPLTIKDVLFNLYVYLDPAYTGSTTLYSVDIVGLNAYRMQDPNAQDGSLADTDESFRGDAQDKINSLIRWATNEINSVDEDDLNTVKTKYKEEIESDWTAIESNWHESYKDSYRFTEAWQAYLLQEGIISVQTKLNANGSYSQIYDDTNGNGKKDDGELYYTTLDPEQDGAQKGTVVHQHIITEVNNHVSQNLSKYMADKNVSSEAATLALQREACINLVYDANTQRNMIDDVLMYWATGNDVLNEFIGQARTKYYEDLREDNGGLRVPTIKGITTYKTSEFNGKNLGAEHDVLKITINGIDPKAPYNFAFSVAPMHYYSGTYNGVNYVTEANGVDKFGVLMGDKNFYDNVVQTLDKNGLPMGAGAYKAAAQHAGDKVDRTTFLSNNIVYFERNEHFTTVGSGIENAKIKKVVYKVMRDEEVVSGLKTQEIDYGEPNATPGNQNEVNSISNLQSNSYKTGGYGYIGINPKFVPDRAVRQAIMRAMDVNLIIKNYYTSALSEQIYRPESTTSWAYPQGVKEYADIAYTTEDQVIIDLVEGAGYKKGSDGVYAKGSSRLEFTFTIAGESTDHPAYAMFLDAKERLEKLGFKINVGPNVQALRLMNSGSLAVWAAAYTSASDPDLYQIYHRDSKATSVNNWNYSGILNDTTGKFSYEYSVIDRLSTLIDEARETLQQSEREVIYAQCYDEIMDLAVILPTYQRRDLYAFNKDVIKASSLNLGDTCSWRMGPIAKLWEVEYV